MGRTPNVCQNWTWENSVFQTDIRGFTHHGKHLCNPNSLQLSQVNTLRWRSILVNWGDVAYKPCAWSTRKRQLQALHEVGQPCGRGWRCQERKLVKWQLRARKTKHFILTAVISQNGILTRKRFIWNQISIQKGLLNFGDSGKLHRLFLGKFGRRNWCGVVKRTCTTSKFSVSSSPSRAT